MPRDTCPLAGRLSRVAAPSQTTAPVNLAERLSRFTDHWSPRTVSTFNGNDIMVVKVKGEFVWHKHDDTDDLPRASRTADGTTA